MASSNIYKVCAFAVIFTLVLQINSAYSEELQTLQIEIKYTNGDRIDAYQSMYKIYQDNEQTPIIEEKFTKNPNSINLPQDHRYKVEVYVNGMYSEVGYIELKNEPKKLDINIPLPGGIKFNVFFEDGETPIENAMVVIKSSNGEEQRVGNTNDKGETMRYWLQSTNLQTDHYVSEIYYDGILLTSLSNIKIHQGISQDQKITVSIPAVVEDLVTFRLYDLDSQKILKKDGAYSIVLVDRNGIHYKESIINSNGEIYFSNIPSGVYSVIVALDGLKENQWENPQVAITGNQNEFELFQLPEPKKISQPFIPSIPEPISEPVIYDSSIKEDKLSCNCVSFRLDDIQDYWLNTAQIELIKLFSEQEIPLTVGIIINLFGNDSELTELIKSQITNNNLEIANHGLDHIPVTEFNRNELDEMLKQSTTMFSEKLNVTPTIFIPPENAITDDTANILLENGFTHLSSSLAWDASPFPLKDESIYRFPQVAETGEFAWPENRFLGVPSDKTFSEVLDGINNYGFAVVAIHPQEYSILKDNEYVNELNLSQIQELKILIEKIKAENIKIVHLGEIDQNVSIVNISEFQDKLNQHEIPSWIKNNAGWWRDGHIDDNSFVQGIQFLIKEGIIQISPTTPVSGNSEIPNWIKTNAGWWAEGKISDDDFIFGVNYLVLQGIIIIDI